MTGKLRVIKFKRRKPRKRIIKSWNVSDQEKLKWLLENGLDLKQLAQVGTEYRLIFDQN